MSTVEFAYNNYVNRSTGKSYFQIVNGYSLCTLIDLFPLPPHMRVSQPVENFAKHIHDLHVEIRRKISLSNENINWLLMCIVDLKNFMLVNMSWFAFVLKEFQKCVQKNFMKEPWAFILSFINYDVYLLDLPNDRDINHVFNVEDLLPYQDTFESSTLSFSVSVGEASKGALTVHLLKYYKEMVDIILDDGFVTYKDGGFHCFIVK